MYNISNGIIASFGGERPIVDHRNSTLQAVQNRYNAAYATHSMSVFHVDGLHSTSHVRIKSGRGESNTCTCMQMHTERSKYTHT